MFTIIINISDNFYQKRYILHQIEKNEIYIVCSKNTLKLEKIIKKKTYSIPPFLKKATCFNFFAKNYLI